MPNRGPSAPVSSTTRSRSSFRAALGALAVGILAGSPAHGQQRERIVREADSAYAAGNLALADSLYYIGARYWPRDPQIRAALGRYLAAQGKTRPAIVLLEEARMFGGDPVAIGRMLAPLYEQLGEWRALLTLPGSPLSIAERRRAAWLSENAFAILSAGGAVPITGTPKADTIARVTARIGGKSVMAAIVGSDVGMLVGTQLADAIARRFEGDPTVVAFDSVTVGPLRLANVPATIGPEASTLTLGVVALGRRVVQIDYARSRIAIAPDDRSKAEARYPLSRPEGSMRVLDRGRWVALADFAAGVARSTKTLVIDVGASEVRVRP